MSQSFPYPPPDELPPPTVIHRLAPGLAPEFASGTGYAPALPGQQIGQQIGQQPSEQDELTAGRLMLHLLLLGLTALTTTALSALLLFNGTLASLGSSVLFSFTLLSILGAHEMGHYLACRWYKVRASLPYFIPAPIGIGTFGAFIRIKSPIPSRRALFDIGIAGPLAGFVFAIPASIVAHYFAAGAPPPTAGDGGGILFHSPLLFQFFEWAFGLPAYIELNPVWLASWIGLLMTSLNLLSVGQLDGGHVVYALFGERVHSVVGKAIYMGVVAMAVHALFSDGWYGWVVYAVLLTLILRAGHPQLLDERDALGRARLLIAVVGLVVFLLSFMPVPIRVLS